VAILQQLGLDITVFYQFALFTVIFLVLPFLFFRPFQSLIELRLARTIEDQKKAEELTKLAQDKMKEYREKITLERVKSRAEFEKFVSEVKLQEAQILSEARNKAKEITQSTIEQLNQQSTQLKRSLEADVEGLSLQISDLILKK
jgi:F0F1-type ATP synthase membrane subunit b/b'